MLARACGLGLAPRAAETFVQAWVDRRWLDAYPAAPSTVAELYDTHAEIATHPAVIGHFGGLGGYKLGAIGAAGEVCLYAPLFRSFLVEAPGDALSAAAINLWQIEPEIGIVMGGDLPARADGAPHSVEAAWAAAEEVVLCVECCGCRGTPAAKAATTLLGGFADTLSSGGVVLGPRLAAAGLRAEALRCATSLRVNGEAVVEGSGSRAPGGGPAEALTWLANHLNSRGLALRRGQLVATGQTCVTTRFAVGDRVEASFAGLGRLEMTIAP